MVQKIYDAFKDAEKWIWANPDKAAQIIGKKTKIPAEAIADLLKNNDRLGLNVVPAAQLEKEVFKIFEMSKWEGHIKTLPDKGVIYRGLK